MSMEGFTDVVAEVWVDELVNYGKKDLLNRTKSKSINVSLSFPFGRI